MALMEKEELERKRTEDNPDGSDRNRGVNRTA